MIKTPEHRFSILKAKFIGTEKSCRNLNDEHEINWEIRENCVAIKTWSKQDLIVRESEIEYNGNIIEIKKVKHLYWMAIDPRSEWHDKYKEENYHRIIWKLGFFKKLTIEGIGQAVFPLMGYYNWVREHGVL